MSVTGAELLNEKWDALSSRFDLLKSVPKDHAALINAAISDWQDWYWDHYENWSAEALLTWQDRYVKAARLLDAVAKKTVTVKTVKQTDAYTPPKKVAVKLPPLLVTAAPPTPPKPLPAFVPVASLDVSSWGQDIAAPSGNIYSRDPGTVGWTPDNGTLPLSRGGLWALLGTLGAGVWLKRQGIL